MEFSFGNELSLENRVVVPDYNPKDVEVENPLRPRRLSEYIGQQKVKENLAVFMETIKQRKETLGHALLYDPPGLGKTTSVGIIASEMGMGVRITFGPMIKKPGDLVAILTNFSPGDVLFIDEIHRLPRSVEEILYPVMEDFAFDIVTRKRQMTTSYHLSLPPFTLVGTTTHVGQLSASLRDHFGVMLRLELYSLEELVQIVTRSARILDIPTEPEGALELAPRSCGTPRVANRLLYRVRDFVQAISDRAITVQVARCALERLEADEIGLGANGRHILCTMIEYHRGGPVGLDTLAAAIEEESVMLEDVYEPYLIQIGSLSRVLCRRCVARSVYLYLGLTPPEDLMGTQQKLF